MLCAGFGISMLGSLYVKIQAVKPPFTLAEV